MKKKSLVIGLVAIVAVWLVGAVPPSHAQGTTVTDCEQGYPYTVQSGNDLDQIAAQFGVPVTTLQLINNITDPNLIDVGQVLCIPDGTYVVQPGDTMDSIAAYFGVTVEALAQANSLAANTQLSVGDVVVIPDEAGQPPVIPTPFNVTYTVQTGDTLDSIAARYGVTLADLLSANHITDPNLIFAGQRIVIPDEYIPDIYIVQAGDTLSGIAARFGTTVGILAQVNHIPNVNLIDTGQALVVPVLEGAA